MITMSESWEMRELSGRMVLLMLIIYLISVVIVFMGSKPDTTFAPYPQVRSGVLNIDNDSLSVSVYMRSGTRKLDIVKMWLVNGDGREIELKMKPLTVDEPVKEITVSGKCNTSDIGVVKLPVYVKIMTNLGNYTIPLVVIER